MIIDARCRPMYDEFLKQVQNPTGVTARMGMQPPRSALEKSETIMLQEMSDAGISMGIAPGRNGHFRYNVSNDCVVDMVRHFKGKFIGIAGINPSDREQALKDIDTYVVNGPLKGVNMEPGSMSTPWYANDRRIYPIYEKCSEHKIPVMLMLGGRAGPDTSYSDPKIITSIARDFPNTSTSRTADGRGRRCCSGHASGSPTFSSVPTCICSPASVLPIMSPQRGASCRIAFSSAPPTRSCPSSPAWTNSWNCSATPTFWTNCSTRTPPGSSTLISTPFLPE